MQEPQAAGDKQQSELARLLRPKLVQRSHHAETTSEVGIMFFCFVFFPVKNHLTSGAIVVMPGNGRVGTLLVAIALAVSCCHVRRSTVRALLDYALTTYDPHHNWRRCATVPVTRI